MPKGTSGGDSDENTVIREKKRRVIENTVIRGRKEIRERVLGAYGLTALTPLAITPIVTEETRYSTVTLPRGRGVQCLQWYQAKQGAIPTVDELTQYRTQFTPKLKSPHDSKEWQLQ